MRKYFCCSIVGYSKLTMEDGKTLEVSVKTEIVDPENGEKPNEPQQCDDLLGKCNLTEEEVWIKPDANENSQDAEKVDAHTTVEVEIVEEELSENKDDQSEDSKLPLKKRKQSSDNTGKPMSDEELIKEEKMEQDAPEENNESNEQAERTEDDKPKATYSRKRVSLTQLELLVEFLEAHRDLARNRLKSREGNALSTRLWTECAAILNAEGDQRTPKQWNKVCSIFKRGPDRKDWYTDFKSRLLSRVRQIRQNSQGNGGPSSLSPLEDRIATLLCKDREVVGRSGTPQMEEQSGIGQINPLATRSISLATFDNIEEAAEPIEIIYEDTVDVQGESLEVAGASTASNHTESEQEATAPCETTAVSQCTAVTAPSQTAAHRQRYSRRRPRRSNRRSSAHYSLERSRDQLLNMEASRIEVERLMAAAYSRMADATYKMADAAAKSAQAQCHIADALENISRSLQNRNKYIMYSYEITKNIQIVTITEEERQVEHMESMNSRRHMRHVCEDCAVGFVLEQAYLMHMKVHSKEAGDHECELCHSHLKTADMLYRHRLRHYRRYRCLLCWTRFKDKDTAACHVMTDHVGTAFECEHCGRGFKRPQYLKRHVEQYHTKPHRLECAVCFRVFHERGWYRSHIRTHNEEVRAGTVKVPVSCDICARVFKNKSCLKRHMLSHEAENVACDICSLVFKNRHMLGQHYLNVHHEKYEGAPDLTCEICLRVCATRAMLKRHMRRMHSDRTKKYQCDHCQRYYLTKGEVRSHISWSHAAGSARGGHACGCGRVFRTPSLLRDHTARFHALEPPPRNHECEHCGKAFSNKQVLNRHKKSHSNEMYPCNECGLLFKTQPYVKVHYQIKHLNMTRAQISAQRKLNKTNRIPQNNIHVKPTWEEPPIPNKKNNIVSENDPLLVQETDIQIKVEREEDDEDVHVPLFQTFVDVNRN